ncbi:protein phosphatase 1 regulatory subunit 42, partial [Acinetobacter baumannii]|nr:protein phosphatase 1 regulatory subunit 42 [Acinetobacter baumannii]
MESDPIIEVKKRIKQFIKNNDSFLDLSNLELKNIPEFDNIQNIERLNLSDNYITKIENVDDLKYLRELNLSNNNIEEINNISKLSQ